MLFIKPLTNKIKTRAKRLGLKNAFDSLDTNKGYVLFSIPNDLDSLNMYT